jgi:DNA-binding Lrp family transcriptional regulator
MIRTALDDLDRRILQALQLDGRLTNVELAQKVGLSPSPCLARVRRLEKEGVIGQYVALLEVRASRANSECLYSDHALPAIRSRTRSL